MPQLDQVTFFSQFFWLCVFYFAFYVILLKTFLPAMNRILRFRKKIQLASSDEYVDEYQSLLQNYHTSRLPEIRSSSDHLTNILTKTNQWANSTLTQFHTTNEESKKMNQMYIRSIGEMTMNQQMMTTSFNIVFPPIQSTQNAGQKKQALYARTVRNLLKATPANTPKKGKKTKK